MTELEYVINNFDAHFQRYENSRIILHGTRAYAENIIRTFDKKYNFTAVVTNDDLPDDTFCGKPVIQTADLAHVAADLVILTERVKYECMAYESIRKICIDSGIKVLDMYGVDIEKAHQDYKIKFRTIEEENKIVTDHDVIIFEMIGSLLVEHGSALIPHSRSRALCRYAAEKRKSVYFSLRKSFSEKKQVEVLAEYGFITGENDQRLIRRQGEDLSLREIMEKHKGKKIVYYGTGFANEFLLPRYYGMDSYFLTESIPFMDALNNIAAEPEGCHRADRGSYLTIKEMINSADVVSFDIFDTLVTRKVLEPEDILEVMRERLKETGFGDISKFIEERKTVQQDNPNSDICRFYEIIQTHMGLTADQRENLMGQELSIEKELIIRRESVCRLYDETKAAGKTIILTSDMYIPGKILGSILNGLGISGWDELLISCEQHTSKRKDLFGVLRRKYPDKMILHLGNDIKADIIPANNNSIRSVLIPSGFQMAIQSGWGKIIDILGNRDEKNLLGLIISRIFNDPFSPADYSMLDQAGKRERFATGACTPLILGYLFWLSGQLSEEKFDKLLLLSRDGYILTDLYEELRKRSRAELPGSIYFYSNRHSAFLLCGDDKKYLKILKEISRADIPATDMFYNLFGFYSKCNGTDLSSLAESNKERIRVSAEQQKRNFKKYLERSGINTKGRYAIMDFVSTGKTADMIAENADIELRGYYFVHRNSPYINTTDIRSYFDEGSAGFFVSYYMEMEHIMTSPESAVDRFDKQGNPVFSEEFRSEEDIRDTLFIQDLIKKTASEYIRHFYHDGITISPLFSAEMYAADGLHGIIKEAFDDWGKIRLI